MIEEAFENTDTKNKWREFDFSKIKGETPFMANGVTPTPALGKYKINDIKIYPDIGFLAGSDEYAVINDDIRNELLKDGIKISDDIPRNKSAYIFFTLDNGRSFNKIMLDHTSIESIVRADDVFYATARKNSGDFALYQSIDMGETWNQVPYIEYIGFFSRQKYLFTPKDEKKIYLTNDGGKTSVELPLEVQMHFLENRVSLYKNGVIFLTGETITHFDVDSMEYKEININFPKNLADNKKRLFVDEESGDIYFSISKNKGAYNAIYYPLDNKLVDIDDKIKKKLPERIKLQVSGKYIGNIIHYNGVPIHIWTLNKGKFWNKEVLDDYLLDQKMGIGSGKIWLQTYVKIKPNKSLKKGTYLAIGTLTGY